MSKRTRRGGAVGLIVLIACLAAAAGAAGGEPSVKPCALGKLPKALAKMVPNRIARAEARFVHELPSTQPSARRRAGRLFAASEAAYLYGFPPVATKLTVDRFLLNTLIGVGQLATPESKSVVAPNTDTLYTVSHIELGDGPMVLHAPDTGDRYSGFQLLDAYSNVIDYVRSGSGRGHAKSVLLAGPGWHGDAPPGVRVLRSPTNLVWLLGRTLVDGPADVPAATEVMGRYSLTALAAWKSGTRSNESVLPKATQPPIEVPTGAEFFATLNPVLAADPPPARDRCALAAFARARVGAGAPATASGSMLAKAQEAASSAGLRLIERALARTQRQSRRRHDGWAFPLADTGLFRRDYANRAVTALSLLGANRRKDSIYPGADVDSMGKSLTGRHRYVIRFGPDQLPPARAFWSLTLYDSDFFLVANPIDRYAVGDRTPGLDYGHDGSLTVYLQHHPPRGARIHNWLPAPAGRFSLRLRLFQPRKAALNGRWQPPDVRRVREPRPRLRAGPLDRGQHTDGQRQELVVESFEPVQPTLARLEGDQLGYPAGEQRRAEPPDRRQVRIFLSRPRR